METPGCKMSHCVLEHHSPCPGTIVSPGFLLKPKPYSVSGCGALLSGGSFCSVFLKYPRQKGVYTGGLIGQAELGLIVLKSTPSVFVPHRHPLGTVLIFQWLGVYADSSCLVLILQENVF